MAEADRIEVVHLARQHLQVFASTVLPLSPQQTFALITHHQNEKIFHHLEKCTYHQVLQKDSASGRVVVESEHLAGWRFLALSGTVRTRLRINQDHRALVSQFELVPAKLSLLRTFGGRWVVAPHPPAADGSERSVLTLEQEIRPAYFLPPPLGTVLKQLTRKQLAGIFQDLRDEAACIRAGTPTLWSASPGSVASSPEAPPTPEEMEPSLHRAQSESSA